MPNFGWSRPARRDLPCAGSVSGRRQRRRRGQQRAAPAKRRGVTAFAAEHAARGVDAVVVAEGRLGTVGPTLQLGERIVGVAGLLRSDHWKTMREERREERR